MLARILPYLMFPLCFPTTGLPSLPCSLPVSSHSSLSCSELGPIALLTCKPHYSGAYTYHAGPAGSLPYHLCQVPRITFCGHLGPSHTCQAPPGVGVPNHLVPSPTSQSLLLSQQHLFSRLQLFLEPAKGQAHITQCIFITAVLKEIYRDLLRSLYELE